MQCSVVQCSAAVQCSAVQCPCLPSRDLHNREKDGRPVLVFASYHCRVPNDMQVLAALNDYNDTHVKIVSLLGREDGYMVKYSN